ncbi:MAG: AC78 family protein, partial [bacterium]|nr:AC78 family protein [bacterium]
MEEKEKTTIEEPEAKQTLADTESNKVQQSNTTRKTSKKAILVVIICVVLFLLLIFGVVYFKISRNNKR